MKKGELFDRLKHLSDNEEITVADKFGRTADFDIGKNDGDYAIILYESELYDPDVEHRYKYPQTPYEKSK